MAEDSTFSPPLSDTTVEYRQLRSLVHAVAISVLILTGTVFIFIYREVVLIRRQTSELVSGIVALDRTNTVRMIEDLRAKLSDYAKQHPDYAPIYRRYFVGTNQPPATGTGPVPSPNATNAQSKKSP